MANKRKITNQAEDFPERIDTLINTYDKTGNIAEFKESAEKLAADYKDYTFIADVLLALAESFIKKGKKEAGYAFVRIIHDNFSCINNLSVLYIRLAENEFELGNIDEGKKYLKKLCDKVSNYSESIEANGLEDVWEKYKDYVKDEIPKSISVNKKGNDAGGDIKSIMNFPEEEWVYELYDYLDEASKGGEDLEVLAPWQRRVYLIFDFITNVNSDGIGHYLYYRGAFFEKLQDAFCDLELSAGIELLRTVKKKLKLIRIPKTEEKWQRIMDKFDDNGMDLEDEENWYYENAEKQILDFLNSYVAKNLKEM
ncbi:MAG: hypothetical protein E7675_08050 [Ruminococcaceae bacterium]|nr:hypothetical protein [Oscillospiraceae bacterium]